VGGVVQKILSSEWNYNIETGKLTNSNEGVGRILHYFKVLPIYYRSEIV